MAIVASGEISLGGNATATRSVACELGRSGTAAICMNESEVRTLAARTTAASAICMDNFYGKANAPTAFGQFFGGGYYTGTVSSPANYYLIIAPNATGCASCQWKTTRSLTGNCSNASCNNNNGYWNTFTYLADGSHPAGNWTATRSIGGFSDWYLPSVNEWSVIYTKLGFMPAGEGYNQVSSQIYWSSTESDDQTAYYWRFAYGLPGNFIKVNEYNTRAVRRLSF